jgi:hypothetical protein
MTANEKLEQLFNGILFRTDYISFPDTSEEFYANTYKYEDDDWINITTDDVDYDSVVAPVVAEHKTEVALDFVRIERTRLLKETDWWAVGDRTMTDEQLAYRQALRDLPDNSPNATLDNNGQVINVTYPTKP